MKKIIVMKEKKSEYKEEKEENKQWRWNEEIKKK